MALLVLEQRPSLTSLFIRTVNLMLIKLKEEGGIVYAVPGTQGQFCLISDDLKNRTKLYMF